MGVFRASGFVLFGEENGEPDVDDEAGEEPETGNPDSGAVEEVVEEGGVFVEGFLTSEDEEVSGKVTGKEEDQGEAGEGDDDFTADG